MNAQHGGYGMPCQKISLLLSGISTYFNIAQEYCRKHCSATQLRLKEVCGHLAEDPAKVSFCHSQCIDIYV